MRLLSVLLAALAVAFASMPAAAQPAQRRADAVAVAAGTPAATLTRVDVDAWLDGLVPSMMRAGAIPGGVVAVVKDGQLLTARGYGYADLATKRPVDPHRTLFALGSISKVFTATAAMQLVEQGRLDLDVDVNRYLDFRLPPRDGRPITLRDLLTHRAGFEEKLKYLVGPPPMMPLDRYIKEWTPHRIFPVGEVPAYSNYGSALMGYIVQRVSGERYDDYMDRHVLGPLGMAHSTFRRPVPASLLPLVSKGYPAGSTQPGYLEYFGPSPAGSLLSTADDAARFMIAHLQRGRIGDRWILSADMAERMHAIQPKTYPALRGMALGFYEQSRNGHRVLAHNGGTQFFHSDMHLFLDDGVGLLVSLNSPGKGGGSARDIHQQLFQGFADRYFPAAPAPLPPAIDLATARRHAALMAGAWEDSRRVDSSILKLLYGLATPITISANDDGTINVPLPTGAIRAREIAPFVWRDVAGDDQLQAVLKDGKPYVLGWSLAPPFAFMPVPAWRSPVWMVPALGLALFVLLLWGLAWPAGAVARRRYDAPFPYRGKAAIAYRVARGGSLFAVLAFAALVALLLDLTSHYDMPDGSRMALLAIVQLMGLLAFLLLPAAAAGDAVLSWSSRGWWARLASLLAVASGALLLWTGLIFHIANLSGHY